MPFRVLWVVCFMRPSIGRVRLWVAVQVEDLNNAFPYGLAVESLFDRDALAMRRFHPMQDAYYVFQVLDMSRHLVRLSNAKSKDWLARDFFRCCCRAMESP